ncbi:MAG: hypothetical protein A2Z01_04525 [Betaproteobacteria bacterium RBG_16_58_11]|nr:MAG: hypothetical protein A2Z01_04525 [Betaproteobacteria bacterium RBG_16_58_11]
MGAATCRPDSPLIPLADAIYWVAPETALQELDFWTINPYAKPIVSNLSDGGQKIKFTFGMI